MDTLVLDSSYQPVCTVSWQRALTLYFQGKAEILENHVDKFVRSVSETFQVPSVIRFFKYVFKRKKAVKFSREAIYQRDLGRCNYCDMKLTRKEATWDHIIPRSLGGQTTWMNITLACQKDNSHKDNRTLAKSGMKLIRQPYIPSSLPGTGFSLVGKTIPETWKDYLSAIYWHAELENDNSV